MGIGPVTLQRFHDLFSTRRPFLGHIKLNTVDVLSHLGDIIPIPTMFCSTWKVLFIPPRIVLIFTSLPQDFDYIVRVHCKNRIGIDFIERGDYEVMRAEDSHIIGQSDLASTVESGMRLEMGIVMRKITADQKKCPRCGHTNSNVVANNGWIEWQVLPPSPAR
jgi:hypothetical protein